MARHLILGGSGFIGRHVATTLARRGHEVVVADRAALPAPLPADCVRAVELLPLQDTGTDWDRLVEKVDVVHHYAWSTIPQTANSNPAADLECNVRGTVELLEALRRRGGGRLVFTSSGGTVYGRLRRVPVPEDHPLDPVTAYGVSKLAVEKYLGFYRGLHGLDCRIARLSNPFGAGQDPNRGQGAATAFIHRALSASPIVIWGDGSVVRDYVHVSDAAEGLVALALAEPGAVERQWTFNIGSGVGTALREIVDHLQNHVEQPLDVRYEPARAFDVPVSVLDIGLARSLLDWRPRLTFAEGVAQTIRDIRCSNFFSAPLAACA